MSCSEKLRDKLLLAWVVVTLILIAIVDAYAATIPAVPQDRIMDILPPKGLATTIVKADGLLTITIDDDRSDWNEAIVYDGDLRAVELLAGITPPSSAVGFWMESGLPFDNDDEALASFDANEQNPYFQPTPLNLMECVAPQMVAEYLSDKKILSPISDDKMHLYVRWYDSSNQALLTEKMRIVVRHTQPQSQYASAKMTPQGDIVANAGHLDYLSSVVKNGEVSYTFSDSRAVNNDSRYILTRIHAPMDATACNQVDLMMGNVPLPLTNGYVELQSGYFNQRVQTPTLQTGVWRENYALEWLDRNGDVIDYSMVVLYINMPEREPWPSYVTDTSGVPWNAVPESRISIQKGAALADVTVDYHASNGVLRYGYQNVLPRADGMEQATVNITLIPPTGAVTYTHTSEGGSGKLGNKGGQYSYMQLTSAAKSSIQNGVVPAWNYPIFQKVDAPDGKVTVYLATLPSDPDECQINLFCWFDSNNQPIGIEYYSVLSDPFTLTSETAVYETEASIPQQHEYPVIVEQNGTLQDCKLIILQYPQSDGDSLYYELRLEDALGNVIEPGQNVFLYLPYPQGHSYEQQEWAYQFQHYDLDYQTSFPIALLRTPEGLRCETSSFSPFVLSWANAPVPTPEPILPQTGDNSMPITWLGLLLLAAVGVFVLLEYRKQKA